MRAIVGGTLIAALMTTSVAAQPRLTCAEIAERPRQFITPEALAYCHMQPGPPTQIALPAPKYSTATVINKSCRTIKRLSIDGVEFNKQIDPGSSEKFTTSMACQHVLSAYFDESVWNSTVVCHGEPYQTYSWGISRLVINKGTLPDESLITEKYNMGIYSSISITSNIDCISIDKIIVNRGNCASPDQDVFGLKFGQTLKFISPCEKLLELEISTDQGIGVFKFLP